MSHNEPFEWMGAGEKLWTLRIGLTMREDIIAKQGSEHIKMEYLKEIIKSVYPKHNNWLLQ